jgi:hypothetical protein
MGQMGQAPQGMPPQGMPPQGMPPQGPAPVMQAASGGLASMPTKDFGYAQGGIVAFQSGGSLDAPAVTADPMANYTPAVMDDPLSRVLAEAGVAEPTTDDETQGNPAMRDEAFQNYLESRGLIKGMKDDDFTPEKVKQIRQDFFDFSQKNAGPNIYEPANKRLKEREEARGKNTRQGQGLALLAAAGAILEGNSLARGAAKAFPVFAKEMGEVQRADLAEQRSIESMQFSLADAQRKERMGDIRGAQAAVESARKAKADANRFSLNKVVALGTLDSKALQSLRPTGKAAGSGSGANKEQPLDRVTAAMNDQLIEMKAKNPNDPRIPTLEAKIRGRKEILATGKEGPTAASRAANQLTGAQNRQLSKEMSAWQDSTEAKKALKAGTFDEAYDAEFTRRQNALMSGISTTSSSGNVIDYDANGKRITK